MKTLKMVTRLEDKMNEIYRKTGDTPDDGYSFNIDLIEEEFDAFTDYLNELGYWWEVEGNEMFIRVSPSY